MKKKNKKMIYTPILLTKKDKLFVEKRYGSVQGFVNKKIGIEKDMDGDGE